MNFKKTQSFFLVSQTPSLCTLSETTFISARDTSRDICYLPAGQSISFITFLVGPVEVYWLKIADKLVPPFTLHAICDKDECF
jgi:hypothetical protein